MQKISSSLIAFVLMAGCSTNLMDSLDEKEPADRAALLLERDKPEEAIAILLEALAENPTDRGLLTLLAASYLQKAGMDTLKLIEALVNQKDAGGNKFTALFAITPTPTTQNLAEVDEAIEILEALVNRNTAEEFQLSIAKMAAMILRVRLVDVDGDGKLSLEEIAGMSPDNAADILAQLLAADEGAQRSVSGTDTSTSKAGEQIAKIRESIQNSEGADDTEKLQNFLAGMATG